MVYELWLAFAVYNKGFKKEAQTDHSIMIPRYRFQMALRIWSAGEMSPVTFTSSRPPCADQMQRVNVPCTAIGCWSSGSSSSFKLTCRDPVSTCECSWKTSCWVLSVQKSSTATFVRACNRSCWKRKCRLSCFKSYAACAPQTKSNVMASLEDQEQAIARGLTTLEFKVGKEARSPRVTGGEGQTILYK